MFDPHLTWLLDHRMEVLVVLILLWSMLTRIALGNVRGSQMALFAAPPVVLVTWVWILDLNLLDWRHASSLMWWTVATGFMLGTVLDWRGVSQRVGMGTSLLFAAGAVGIQAWVADLGALSQGGGLGVSAEDPSAWWSYESPAGHALKYGLLLATLCLVLWRSRVSAQGSSLARYVSHFLFALGVAYLMRVQGFDDAYVLVIGLMAVHLVVPALMGALDAGWLRRANALPVTPRTSHPGWAGVLGLLMPLYLTAWSHVSLAPIVVQGTLGLRALAILTLLLLADLVLRPSGRGTWTTARSRSEYGARTFFLLIACGLMLTAILIQQVQRDLFLAL